MAAPMAPPLVLDIDGTLTLAGSTRSPAPIDPAIFEPLRTWPAPIILATGKAFPAPVSLCQFIGLPVRVIAETGGIVCVGEQVETLTAGHRHEEVRAAMADRGFGSSGGSELINRWRETETAFPRNVPLEVLREVAAGHDLEVVDTGYAYHVKDPSVSKGEGLERLLALEGIDPQSCTAIGDSPNDISLFERVGRAVAVANAHPDVKEAADFVTDRPHARGTLDVLKDLR